MPVLHDILYWGLLGVSSALPVFIALVMWMIIASRAQKVAEFRQRKESLGTGIYVTKFAVLTVLTLVTLFTLNFVAISGLSPDEIPLIPHTLMATIPISIGSGAGAIVVLLGSIIFG